ncbi:MAG: universal stress protein [Gemmatimonadota bacterium]
MKRILLPLDGSEFAERALAPATSLAARLGAELHLASVVSDLPPIPLASGDGEIVSRWFDDEKKRAEKYLGGVRDKLATSGSTTPFVTHVRVGPVARTLVGIGKEIGADLVVLTTHGRGAWQRAWLGSVADQLLRQGTFPLLLLPGEEEGEDPFRESDFPHHVLVPLDGSTAAESVFDLLPAVVPRGGAKVTLATVIHQPFPLSSVYLPHAVTEEALTTERRTQMEKYLTTVAAQLATRGFGKVDTRILDGEDAAGAVLEVAEAEKVDLIALSTHGRGGVSRLLLGSVADKIVRGSRHPLLVAHRPEE